MDALFPDLDFPTRGQAIISPCETYRYRLERRWRLSGTTVNFILLNPSKANESIDDNTSTRLTDYAKRWGHAGYILTNLFAFRATDPADMLSVPDPIGPENDYHIRSAASDAQLIVVGWGRGGSFRNRAREVMRILYGSMGRQVYAWQENKDGSPAHPLYLSAALQPKPYRKMF